MQVHKDRVSKVLAERQKQYGDATKHFATIGIIWGALLKREPIPAHEVALMMDALKTVRLFNDPLKLDSWDDKLGYITLALNSLEIS